MWARAAAALALLLIAVLCLSQTALGAHLGPFTLRRRSLPADRAEVSETEAMEVAPPATPMPALPKLPFADRVPASSSPNVNLFEEYMSRGLYTCTSSYLDALGKLHALIAEVYEDYQACQKMMKTTAKTFSRTDIDALDDMLDEWEREERASSSSSSSVGANGMATSSSRTAPEGLLLPPTSATLPEGVASDRRSRRGGRSVGSQ